MTAIPKVAIACQGGGSHAAFAAGVLAGLLRPEMRARFDLVALSGTSGGAMCAALAWAGLIGAGADDATERLKGFWRDIEADDPLDAVANLWNVISARLPISVELSPYLYEPTAEPKLRSLLRSHLGLEQIATDARQRARLKLCIGATDVLSGDRVVFAGETLTYDELIASAAVPPLFRAVSATGRLCWDGLFTSNPPVREFTDLAERPDEIWVVQINPQLRASEPRTMQEILDRRNELAGNLALGQELHFIETINRLLEAHPALAERYQPIRIRVVPLGLPRLDHSSKLDRSSALIAALFENGVDRSAWFFDERSAWPRAGTPPAASVRPARTPGGTAGN